MAVESQSQTPAVVEKQEEDAYPPNHSPLNNSPDTHSHPPTPITRQPTNSSPAPIVTNDTGVITPPKLASNSYKSE